MIINTDNLNLIDCDLHVDKWTLIIPAAGKGTRLGYNLPKILFPISGYPIISYILNLCSKFISEIIFIVSPNGKKPINDYLLSETKDLKWRFAYQVQPKGMAEAVYIGLKKCKTLFSLCIWGDQPAIKLNTLVSTMKALEYYPNYQLALPTIIKYDPYIHLDRYSDGKIKKVLQKREGDDLPILGESDCGLFAMKVPDLLEIFETTPVDLLIGRNTKKINFLPILRFLSKTISLRITTEIESLDVNDL
jgi:bifunctional N-acetylglucosamine-1-phosphate-uridyltransferase/glucosamine-1-phosphate-acetyltransferase GlmU-like protein